MKHKYIESLLSEIQQLESKVINLKENQKVPFSFFKESFKQTQKIAHLLHELEFVQIEDMKGQMEKLVHFLSDSENTKDEVKTSLVVETTKKPNEKVDFNKTEQDAPKVEVGTHKADSIEKVEEQTFASNEVEEIATFKSSHEATGSPSHQIAKDADTMLNNQKDTIVDHLSIKSKSLNDIQPINHTILDAKRSISLNDRFLFQRELFDNNREAMNDMLVKLQTFSSYETTKSYLEVNTDWDFTDETVDKFMQMLKDSF